MEKPKLEDLCLLLGWSFKRKKYSPEIATQWGDRRWSMLPNKSIHYSVSFYTQVMSVRSAGKCCNPKGEQRLQSEAVQVLMF